MRRRVFLQGGIASAAFGWLSHRPALAFEKKSTETRLGSFWTDGFFRQTTVEEADHQNHTIRAFIQGNWETYTIRELPEEYLDWNFKHRLSNMELMRSGRRPDWSGAHNAAVATVGKNRGDSRFTLNNAIKGMGVCPGPDRIDELTERLKSTSDQPHADKFNVLESMYLDRSLWDARRLVSLELYSTPEFETHTFLNQMANPLSTIVFLDIPSYEIRAATSLYHPRDPDLSEYGQKIVRYVNTIHTYMHSHFTRVVPAVVYHVIEIYNNSPASRGGGNQKGVRIV